MGFEELIGAASALGGHPGSGSNKILVWILIFIVVFGFGNGKKCCGLNCNECEVKRERCSSHRRRRRSRCSKECCNLNNGMGGLFGNFGFNKFFGNNGLFILVIIGLLFLCRDKKETTTTTTTTTD